MHSISERIGIPVATKHLRPYLDAFLNFIYPPFCLTCDTRLLSAANPVCEDCWRQLPRTKSHDGTPAARKRDSKVSRYLAVWEYDGKVQNIIHEFKFSKMKTLAQPLGEAMAELACQHDEFLEADVVVPVPLHRTRLRERGFNQSLMLSEAIAAKLAIPVEPRLLKRRKSTQSQSKLNARQRENNVRDAFELGSSGSQVGRTVILVDDVCTTGATLRACAQTLTQGGAQKIVAITAAATDENRLLIAGA